MLRTADKRLDVRWRNNMKKITLFLLLCLITISSYAYQPLPPEVKYHISENEKYLLEILPCSKQYFEIEGSNYGLRRTALIIISYKKQSVKTGSEDVFYWQEMSFFRKNHPDSVTDGFPAEAIQGIISNDGNIIAILAQVNPMASIQPVDVLYIYGRAGDLLKSISQEKIFSGDIKDIRTISIDENTNSIRATSVEDEIRYIDLNTFKIR
jgi:hypothetical protein